MPFTNSLINEAVRYLVLDLTRRFSASLAAFFASSAGTFASRMSELAILLTSNSSSVKCEVRTTIPRGLIAFFSTRSATSSTILPKSVKKYFFASTSASTKSAFNKNFR